MKTAHAYESNRSRSIDLTYSQAENTKSKVYFPSRSCRTEIPHNVHPKKRISLQLSTTVGNENVEVEKTARSSSPNSTISEYLPVVTNLPPQPLSSSPPLGARQSVLRERTKDESSLGAVDYSHGNNTENMDHVKNSFHHQSLTQQTISRIVPTISFACRSETPMYRLVKRKREYGRHETDNEVPHKIFRTTTSSLSPPSNSSSCSSSNSILMKDVARTPAPTQASILWGMLHHASSSPALIESSSHLSNSMVVTMPPAVTRLETQEKSISLMGDSHYRQIVIDRQVSNVEPIKSGSGGQPPENIGESSSAGQKQQRNPMCSKCRNHGLMSAVKGHKRFCPKKDCRCKLCKLTVKRQKVMATNVKVTRALKEDKMFHRDSNLEETLGSELDDTEEEEDEEEVDEDEGLGQSLSSELENLPSKFRKKSSSRSLDSGLISCEYSNVLETSCPVI